MPCPIGLPGNTEHAPSLQEGRLAVTTSDGVRDDFLDAIKFLLNPL